MNVPVDGSSRPVGAAPHRPLSLPVLVATVAGIGFVPFAPGTFGSIPGVALALGLRQVGPWWAEGAALVLLFVAGVWAANAAETHFGRIDPGPVVIDEVVGMLITALFLPLTWTGWLVAFLVFRACDVVKPFPAGRAERLPGGFGVMCDDVLAGVWGYVIMRGLLWAFQVGYESVAVSLPALATAEIVAVGSELLVPPRLDTNSLTVTTGLSGLGISVGAKHIVGDRVDALARVIADALTRADLVVLTGGLGPTDDDVTRDAVARVVGRPLIEDPAIVARLEARFAARGIPMPAINLRQALVVEHGVVLDNSNGTAPGQWVEHGVQVLILLPGPPRELTPMLETLLRGRLAARAPATRVHMRTVLVAGLGESHAEERLQPLYRAWAGRGVPIEATILASAGQLELQLYARADAAPAAMALQQGVDEVAGVLGPHVISTDGRSIEAVVGAMLTARGWKIAVAESCTGGLVTSRLTDIPGSSAWVERAVVAYSNDAKVALLGVAESDIAAHGAVSEVVAVAMAEGVRRLAGVEVGVGITGIAGPTGGSENKPVGTVCLAVAHPGGPPVVKTNRYPGERIYVKTFASLGAIDLVRRTLAETGAAADAAPGTWEQAGRQAGR